MIKLVNILTEIFNAKGEFPLSKISKKKHGGDQIRLDVVFPLLYEDGKPVKDKNGSDIKYRINAKLKPEEGVAEVMFQNKQFDSNSGYGKEDRSSLDKETKKLNMDLFTKKLNTVMKFIDQEIGDKYPEIKGVYYTTLEDDGGKKRHNIYQNYYKEAKKNGYLGRYSEIKPITSMGGQKGSIFKEPDFEVPPLTEESKEPEKKRFQPWGLSSNSIDKQIIKSNPDWARAVRKYISVHSDDNDFPTKYEKVIRRALSPKEYYEFRMAKKEYLEAKEERARNR